MKALILNSGLGSRMGDLTKLHPKCMTELITGETIIERQLKQLEKCGIDEVVITTGYYNEVLVSYCESLGLNLKLVFVNNEKFRETNYIYSIYCARDILHDDLILMHGDLVFTDTVLKDVINSKSSCMTVSSTLELPEKDFKARIENGYIREIGINVFDNAMAAQPLYCLKKDLTEIWLNKIIEFCEKNEVKCYAENALNEELHNDLLGFYDFKDELCNEIDNENDLMKVNDHIYKKSVYLCFSTDVIHGGHLNIIREAAKLGEVIVGVMSDKAVASYKRYPLVPLKERMELIANINGVSKVVVQEELSYKSILEELKPNYVVHGDDWKEGFQKPVRDEVIEVLASYGGELVELPYSDNEVYREIERQSRSLISLPDVRRGRLKKLLDMGKLVSVIEAHSGITGLIAEKTKVYVNGETRQFDAMWVSSLCDSTAKGKPDIELVDMSSRMRTIDDIMEVTTKPIILDGDTGGLTEHFVYTVRTLERMGVSAVIIEDKTGLKKNSLFGTEVAQTQDSIENFSAKIAAGKKAQKTSDFMIIARIESLILEKGQEDAMNRAKAYVEAGADGIMIHSRKKDPSEIFEFVKSFREWNQKTPIVVVPTSFNSVTEEEFEKAGVNVVIYANQLTRSGFPAMQKVAETILTTHRAKEADDMCMPIKQILTLIPEE